MIETVIDGVTATILTIVGLYVLYNAVAAFVAVMTVVGLCEVEYEWCDNVKAGRPGDFSSHYEPKTVLDFHAIFWYRIVQIVAAVGGVIAFFYLVGAMKQAITGAL